MKKTLRSLKLACLAAVSMLVVSCGGSADYRNFLPADSFMTMSVNPASLLQKSDAGDIGQHPLFIRLKAELDKAEGITAEEKEPLRIGCRPEKRPVLLHVDGWRDAVPECPGRYAAARRRQGETGRPACTHRREKRHCTPARGRCFGHRIGRGQLRERFVRLQRCGCHALFRAGVAGKRNRCR